MVWPGAVLAEQKDGTSGRERALCKKAGTVITAKPPAISRLPTLILSVARMASPSHMLLLAALSCSGLPALSSRLRHAHRLSAKQARHSPLKVERDD